MPGLKARAEIRAAYAPDATAEAYIDARFTSAWGAVMHARQVKVLTRIIRANGVNRVLEIAPGPARLSADLRGFKYGVACEANAAMLRVARRRLADRRGGTNGSSRPTWHLVQGDAFRVPFRGPFDLVYGFRLIRHFEARDRAALYAQVRSVLADGGLFAFDAINVAVAQRARTKENPGTHLFYDELYEKRALVAEIREAGFTPLLLTGVVRHMTAQHWIQVLIGPRSHAIARLLIRLLEHVPGKPLEWVVICRKGPDR